MKHVAIIGLGYVGLPLAVAFARAGARVTGLDCDVSKVAMVNSGRSYIEDVSEIFGVRATADVTELSQADAIIICVPTPLNSERLPDLSAVDAAIDAATQCGRRGSLIVLESTTYPGTTRERLLPKAQARGQLVAFSPERVDPGNKEFGIKNTPKVVGAVDDESLAAAVELYSIVSDRVVSVSTLETAETVKLLENAYRAINIALVNEVANAADALGVDIREVVRAATTKPFGFMPFYPGAGVGGHCIPIDPIYLAHAMRASGNSTRMIDAADAVNRARPIRAVNALSCRLCGVEGKKVLVCGLAYKPNISDTRESPALEIVAELTARGALVSCYDPIAESSPGATRVDELHPEQFEAVIVATQHDELDVEHVSREARVVVDCNGTLPRLRNVIRP